MIMNYEDKLMQHGFRFSYNSATLYILLNTTDNLQGYIKKKVSRNHKLLLIFCKKVGLIIDFQ